MSTEAIKKKQVAEVRRLRPINRARIIQYVVLSALFVTFVSYLPDPSRNSRRAEITAARLSLKESIAVGIESSTLWLVGHGYQFEVDGFSFVATSLFSRLAELNTDSFIFIPYAYFIDGIIRIAFFLIASFRFLLVCVLWGIFSSSRTAPS